MLGGGVVGLPRFGSGKVLTFLLPTCTPVGDLGWVHIIGPSLLRASVLGPLLSLSGPHWPSYIFPVSEANRRSSTDYNRVLFGTFCPRVRRSSLKA